MICFSTTIKIQKGNAMYKYIANYIKILLVRISSLIVRFILIHQFLIQRIANAFACTFAPLNARLDVVIRDKPAFTFPLRFRRKQLNLAPTFWTQLDF